VELGRRIRKELTTRCRLVEEDDTADDPSFQEVGVALVDFLKAIGLGDEFIELEAAGAVELEEVGEVDAGIDVAVEGSDHLLPKEHQVGRRNLHGVGRDWCQTDHDAAPGFAGGAVGDADVLGFDVADGDDGLIGADAVGEVEDALDGVLVLGVDGVGGAELLGSFELPGDDIDGDDLGGAGEGGALDGVHAHAAEAKDGHHVTRTHFGTLCGGTKSCRHTTGNKTCLIQGDIRLDADECLHRSHNILAKAPNASKLSDVPPIHSMQPKSPVEQCTAGDVRATITKDRETGEAPPALAARGNERQDDMVARLHFSDTGADLLDDASALVTCHNGIVGCEVASGEVPIGVAHAGCYHLDQDLSGFRLVKFEFFHLELPSGPIQDSSTGLHVSPFAHSRIPTCSRYGSDEGDFFSTIASKNRSCQSCLGEIVSKAWDTHSWYMLH